MLRAMPIQHPLRRLCFRQQAVLDPPARAMRRGNYMPDINVRIHVDLDPHHRGSVASHAEVKHAIFIGTVPTPAQAHLC